MVYTKEVQIGKQKLIFETFMQFDIPDGIYRGTGIGLSIANHIIKKHNGSIEVNSSLGQGSTFIVEIPVCE